VYFDAAGQAIVRNIELIDSQDGPARRITFKIIQDLVRTFHGGLSDLLVRAALSLAPDLLPPSLLRNAQALPVPQGHTWQLESEGAAGAPTRDPVLERTVKQGLYAHFDMRLLNPQLEALRPVPAGLFERLIGNPEHREMQALYDLLRDAMAVRRAPCPERHSLQLASTLALWLLPALAAPQNVVYFSVAAVGGAPTTLAPEALSPSALADLSAEHEVPATTSAQKRCVR